MALKIKQDGKVKDLIIPACGVQILDMEDNFESSNLEEVLQEIGKGESVYISDKEPDKDGIWISSDNTTTVTDNPTLVALKEYVNTQISTQNNSFNEKLKEYYALRQAQTIQENDDLDNYKDYGNYVSRSGAVSKTLANCPYTVAGFVLHVERTTGAEETFKMQTLITNSGNCDVYRRVLIDGVWRPWVLEIKDIHISNPNLLINGDFQVFQRGTSFNIVKGGKYIYTADRWAVQTDSDNVIVSSLKDGGMRLDMSKFNGTYTNVIQFLELPFYKKLIGKTVTIKVKFKNEVSNIIIGLRALPDQSATHIQLNKTSSEFVITAKIPNCSTECTKFMIYIQSRQKQIMDFDYIKLEVGSVSTQFISRSYGEELSLCQRYYQNDFLGRVQLRSHNDSANTSTLLGFIQYATPMRIRPTLKFKEGVNLTQSLFGASFGLVTPTKLHTFTEGDTTGMHLGFNLTQNVGTANVYFSLRRNILEAEAELY